MKQRILLQPKTGNRHKTGRGFVLFAVSFFLLLGLFACESFDPFTPAHQPGDTLWIHDLPGSDSLFIDHTLALGKDGSVYYAAGGGTVFWTPSRIFALNPSDGSIKWQSGKIDHIGLSSRIVVGDNGTIYVCGYYRLFAINPQTGAFEWQWELPDELMLDERKVYTKGQIGALALTDNGDLILATPGSGVYYRGVYLISQNGSLLWYNLKLGLGFFSGITIGRNNTAFFYSNLVENNASKHYLMAIDLASGALKWKTEVLSWLNSANNIVVGSDGNLCCTFATASDNTVRIRRVDGASGTILSNGSDEASAGYKLIATDGTCIVTGAGFKTYDSAGKNIRNQMGSYGALDQKNRVTGADYDTGLHHTALCQYKLDGTLDFSVGMNGLLGEEIVINDDKVIFGIINLHPTCRRPSKICAIQGDARLSDSAWPRPAHDNRNTSNANKR
ncbi:MAG TPA: PQQ-binding-like beta-propeller repeat protein [Prolixibacteraceae bacterium]|nr:PQQ-binding-like beta-propeller repeat protein [Prolixibacteraceae bacterium]